MTSVFSPRAAVTAAVAAAAVVFPTPPFPVNRRTRMSGVSAFDALLEVLQGRVDDLALDAPTDEAGYRDRDLDGQVVGDLGSVTRRFERVGADLGLLRPPLQHRPTDLAVAVPDVFVDVAVGQ